jgi:hypothetical protein
MARDLFVVVVAFKYEGKETVIAVLTDLTIKFDARWGL